MELLDKALAYNREAREALAALRGELNQGQQKKVMKNPIVRAWLVRYGIINGESVKERH